MDVAHRARGEAHGQIGDVVGGDLEARDAVDQRADLGDLAAQPPHEVDGVALVEHAPPALLGVGHVELAVVLAGIARGQMVGVLGPRRSHGSDAPFLEQLLREQHGRPVAPVVGGEHLEALGVAELEEVFHAVHGLGEGLLDHEVRATLGGQAAQGEVRVGRRADHGAVGAREGGLRRGRDGRPRKILGRGLALGGGGIVGGKALDADRPEISEVPAADRAQSEDGELHLLVSRTSRGADGGGGSAACRRFHSFS